MVPVIRPALAAASALGLGLAAAPAFAGMEISLYGGAQSAPHSRVKGSDPGGVGDFNFLAGWEGEPFESPPYYGVRVTWWSTERLGFGIDINHAKVYATRATKADNGFSTLEFSDGLNLVTANAYYRWPGNRSWTPYVGAGLGLSIPHVEVTTAGGRTFNYQYGGPAATLIAGVNYQFNQHWSMFGEYKVSYSVNNVDLDNGGNLKTDIVTNALNIGVSYGF